MVFLVAITKHLFFSFFYFFLSVSYAFLFVYFFVGKLTQYTHIRISVDIYIS